MNVNLKSKVCKVWWLLLWYNFSYFYDGNKLRQFPLQIFRHGARTPLTDYPLDPYTNFNYGVQGLGQLTGEGKHWSYRLGQYLRCRYGSFLSKDYSIDQVYCRSSQTDRTSMTASAVLAGLFPPNPANNQSHVDYPALNWQPIPCFTIDTQLDNKLQFTRPCPHYETQFAAHLTSLTNNLDRKTIKLFQALSKVTGNNITNYDNLSDIYYTVTIQHCQFFLDYPKWFLYLWKEMRSVYELDFVDFVSTQKFQQFVAGPLLHQIITNLELNLVENASNIPSNLRQAQLYLFSAHDTTISPLMVALGIYDSSQPPPYNSALFFELHKNSQDSSTWIKVFYKSNPNGIAKEIPLPNCPSPCTLSDFKNMLTPILVDDTTWDSICGNPVSTIDDTNSN